jgi:uncharacterized membrane protein (UPF0127 family)
MIASVPPPPIRVAFVRAPGAVLHLLVANDDRRGALYCGDDVAPKGTDGRVMVYATDTTLSLAGTITDQTRDVVLVADSGTVVAVTAYALESNSIGGPPRGSTQIFARYVIELSSGRAYREGIVPGAKIQIPPLEHVAAPVNAPPCRRDIR